jgi:hypothetical protein
VDLRFNKVFGIAPLLPHASEKKEKKTWHLLPFWTKAGGRGRRAPAGEERGAGELSRAVATRLIPASGCRPFEL